MTVSEARAALPRVLERVLAGEEVTLTRNGEPVAVVVHPSRLRTRRADQALSAAERVRDLLDRAALTELSTTTGLTQERADALVAAVRRDRSTE